MSFTQENFIDFIDHSLTPAHFTQIARSKLLKAGYVEIDESIKNENIPEKFFVIRQHRAIVAINKKNFDSGVIVGAHIDSPVFKISKNSQGFELGSEYYKVFRYGGGTWMTWMDRDLRIAGRAIFQKDGQLYSKIIQSEKAVCTIPSLAVHLRSLSGLKPQLTESNFRPIFALKDSDDKKSTLDSIVSQLCGCEESDLIDYDISLIPNQKASVTGITGEFIHSARLDDLSCAIPCFEAFLSIDQPSTGTCVFVGYDNEEIGSGSRCGARSDFVETVLELAGTDHSFFHRSIILSADVNQGYNPNYDSCYNKTNRGSLGQGLLWGVSPQMALSTTMPPYSFVQQIADEEEIPINPFSDKPFTTSGSTMGQYFAMRFGTVIVDVGVPLLAMHSIRELGSFVDIEYMYKLTKATYEHISEVQNFRKSID